MFIKTGDAQPLDVAHTCCVCEMSATKQVGDKYYCAKHQPQEQLEQPDSTEQPPSVK